MAELPSLARHGEYGHFYSGLDVILARLDDLLDSVGIEPCKLCTYCWNGRE